MRADHPQDKLRDFCILRRHPKGGEERSTRLPAQTRRRKAEPPGRRPVKYRKVGVRPRHQSSAPQPGPGAAPARRLHVLLARRVLLCVRGRRGRRCRSRRRTGRRRSPCHHDRGLLLLVQAGEAVEQAGARDEGVVVQGVEGGLGPAVRVVERRGPKERPLARDQLTTRVGLEVVDEEALDGGSEGHGQEHAHGAAHRAADDDAQERERGVDLDGGLHHQGREHVVRHVLRHHGDDERPERAHRAHEEAQENAGDRREEGTDHGHEVQHEGGDADEAGVGVANEREARRHHEAVGERGDERAAHVAAHGAGEDGKGEDHLLVVLRTGDDGELAHDLGVVEREPVRQDEAQEEGHEVAGKVREVGNEPGGEVAREVGRYAGARLGEHLEEGVHGVLDVGVVGGAEVVPEGGEAVLELGEVGRDVSQEHHELACEGSHKERDDGHDGREHYEQGEKVVDAVIAGGINLIELTMTMDEGDPVGFIKLMAEKYKDNDKVVIGAGTVLDPETARACILAGANYIVSPGLNVETIKLCNRYRVPMLPGVMTPTEAITAMEAGADIIKIFPGNIVGPAAISSFKGPLPQGEFMPSGGVDVDNVDKWLKAGAYAVWIKFGKGGNV